VKNYVKLAATLLSAFVLTAALARAQAPAAPKKIYTHRQQFRLPVKIDDKDRANLDRVELWVKGDAEPWACKQSAGPNTQDFKHAVSHDGEYWFSVVTVDKSGKSTPADVTHEAPGLVVVVDTRPPEFDLHVVAGANGQRFLKCVIQDDNADYSKTKIEYQDHGVWQVLDAIPGEQGVFRLPESATHDVGLVRATVYDRADNSTTHEMNPLGNQPRDFSVASSGVVESKSDKPVVQASASSDRGPGPVQLISSTHATLAYEIEDRGVSGIGKVEVWLTRDGGQSWQYLCEDPDRQSPVKIELPGDGLFGVSLAVTNGNGNGSPPPARGDQPSYWIEVDTLKPSADLVSVHPVTGEDGTVFVINWTASDKNLKPDPINLYYATRRDGQWLEIAHGLRNDGSYRWAVPHGAGQEFYIRLEVADRAGNVTRCDSTQPIILDFSRPKGRVTGVQGDGDRPFSN
jgi:hypothetical protein